MRAINLVPAEDRRGAGGAGGRTGGAAYVLLGFLAVVVALSAFHVTQKKSVSDKRAEVVSLESQAAASEAKATELASFSQFAGLRAARVQTVSSLASSRFDWSHALSEIARVIPRNVSLTSLQGTIAPGVSAKSGGGGGASGLRAAIPVPAIELAGCTADQDSVARMLTRMRLIDGVTRVSLQSAVKADAASGAGASNGAAGQGGCNQGKPGQSPTFALVVFFDQVAGSVPATSQGAGRIAAASMAPGGTTGATGAAAIPSGVTP